MRVCVLGATEVWRDDQRVSLGTRKRRALVSALALSGGRPVSVDALVDLLWADSPPDGVAGTLQVYVSGLRRAGALRGRASLPLKLFETPHDHTGGG